MNEQQEVTEAEVNALTGDDIRYWLENPFMTPDLLVDKVCFWVGTATRAAVDEIDAALTSDPEVAR